MCHTRPQREASLQCRREPTSFGTQVERRAFHENHLSVRRFLSHRLSFCILWRIPPRLRLLRAGEFEDHESSWMPRTFERLYGSAAKRIPPSIRSDGWRSELLVLVVRLLIVDFDLHNHKCWHDSTW